MLRVKKEYYTGFKIHYQNKASFQPYMACWNFKDLSWKTVSDKLLCDKAFNMAKIVKYSDIMGIKKFFHKTSAGCSIESEIIRNTLIFYG